MAASTTIHVLRSVRLENTTTRKAWYFITLEDHGGVYKVRTSWGRLDGKGKPGEKLTPDLARRFAESYFEGKLKDKTTGDYVIVNSSATTTTGGTKPPPAPSPPAAPTTSIFDKTVTHAEWAKVREERRNAAPWGKRK